MDGVPAISIGPVKSIALGAAVHACRRHPPITMLPQIDLHRDPFTLFVGQKVNAFHKRLVLNFVFTPLYIGHRSLKKDTWISVV